MANRVICPRCGPQYRGCWLCDGYGHVVVELATAYRLRGGWVGKVTGPNEADGIALTHLKREVLAALGAKSLKQEEDA